MLHPDYTTRIAPAWRVKEKMREDGETWERFMNALYEGPNPIGLPESEAARILCIAALKAKEVVG